MYWSSVRVLYTSVLRLKTLVLLVLFYTMFISKFGAFGQNLEAPLTLSLAPGASIGGNMYIFKT